jgi:hypothetical protein
MEDKSEHQPNTGVVLAVTKVLVNRHIFVFYKPVTKVVSGYKKASNT